MTALLSVRGEDKDKTLENLKEAKKMGIKIQPPHINESVREFTPETDGVRFGLLSIAGVGPKAVDYILLEREERTEKVKRSDDKIVEVKKGGPFKSFDDFHDRIVKGFKKTPEQKTNPINRSVIRTLIQAGCFDEFEPNRYKLLNYYNLHLRRDKEWIGSEAELEKNSAKSNHSFRYDEKAFNDKLMLEMEHNLIGIYVSGSPYEGLPFTSLQDMELSRGRRDKTEYDLGGRIIKSRVIKTKKGDPMAFVEIETQLEPIEFTVFPDTYDEYSQHLYKDNIIVVRGYKEKSFYRGEEKEQFIATKVLVKEAKKLKKQMGISDRPMIQEEEEEKSDDLLIMSQSDKIEKKSDPVADLFDDDDTPKPKKRRKRSKELELNKYII